MPLHQVSSTAEFNSLLAENSLFVVNFTAEWCGPCRAISPKIEQLAEQNKKVKIVKVDVGLADVAKKYNVSVIPTFCFFHNQKEISRVTGASFPQIQTQVNNLANLSSANDISSPDGKSGSSSSSSASNFLSEIKKYIPKGYDTLNSIIDKTQLDGLNITPLYSKNTLQLSTIFELSHKKESEFVSDADSQILIFIPFHNHSKVYSVLIKFKLGSKEKETSTEVGTPDYPEDELQPPTSLKIWSNTPGVISFDDATDGKPVQSIELNNKVDENGWIEVKLRFVKFQNATSLVLFFDGEDEDNHTIIEKIVFVGNSGISKDQGKIEKIGEAE